MAVFDQYTLEIEHTPGTWTDYSDRLLMPIKIRRGRPTFFDRTGAAVLTVKLRNHDGELMPELIGATHYPHIVEDIGIRFRPRKSLSTYTRFDGWITTILPMFDEGSLAKAYVTITAVDSLGKLALKRLRSSWIEQLLYRGRNLGVQCDAYEPRGKTNSLYLFLDQLSKNTSSPGQVSVNFTAAPPLSISTDDIVSAGQAVQASPDSSDHTWLIQSGISPGSQCVQFLYRTPTQHTPDTSTVYSVLGLLDANRNRIANLGIKNNGGNNGLSLWNSDETSSLGFIRNLDYGQWHVITIIQNASTATHSDITADRVFDHNTQTTSDLAFDIRNVYYLEIPGLIGHTLSAAWAGLIAIKDRSSQSYHHGVRSGDTTMAERMTSLAGACSELPVSFTQVGTWTALACTGDWSGRTALEVGNEICGSIRNSSTGSTGVLFGRPKDSQILAISGSETYPADPLVEVEWSQDMLRPLQLNKGIERNPTRVTVTGPQKSVTSIDTDAESAGRYKEFTLGTINRSGYSDAADIADWYLVKNNSLRVEKLRIDLVGAVNDPTDYLFDETGTNTGLFPTAKVRIPGMPSSHFTFPVRDVHVEGWDEVYDESIAYLDCDTSPSPVTQRASDDFTGSDGAALAGQWVSGSTSTGGTAQIQTDRARLNGGTLTNGYISRRLDLSAVKDGHLTGSVILRTSTVQAYAWVRGSSNLLTTGYSLKMSPSGTIYVERKIDDVVQHQYSFNRSMNVGTQYGWRIWIIDKYLRARVWTWGFPEGKDWDFDIEDSTITSTGYFGIAVYNNGTASQYADFDDIVLTDAGSRA